MIRPLALCAAVLALCAATAGAVTDAQRLRSLHCYGDVAHAPRGPVLLIPGTGVDARENWSWGYQKALLDQGHGVCTIDLPYRSTVDVQESVRYTVAAIREVARRAHGRRISTIGHSQGASQAIIALRGWPRLGRLVDDVIGLSGAYDNGSEAIRGDCSKPCVAPFWQFATGSHFLRALHRLPLPHGPSYTAIGTLYDSVVTPQPRANVLPGARSIQIQDICPGRRFVQGEDHIFMAADAVAFALATDALDHPGPADPARIPATTCALQTYPQADLVKLATLAPALANAFQGKGQAPPVDREPRVRCPFAPRCHRSRPEHA